MKRTHKHLEVVVGTQVDYLLPEGKAAVPQGHQIIVPGLRRLMDLQPESCAGVLFVNNYFTETEYKQSAYAKEHPPHCLVPGLDDYEAVGVQNVFSRYLLMPRGVPCFRGYKKTHSMWERDMWENPMKVDATRGSAATAETLPQFIGSLNDGVSNVVIWGLDTELEVAPAIDGFLVNGFKVCVLFDLCRTYTEHSTSFLNSKFSQAMAAGQLEISKYADILQHAKRKPL